MLAHCLICFTGHSYNCSPHCNDQQYAMLMGCCHTIMLPQESSDQMKILGNAISVPHAATTILNGITTVFAQVEPRF